MWTREYGHAGRIGVGTPQGNPTVEAEFRRLLSPDVESVTTRLHSAQRALRDRLTEYLECLDAGLESFGGMRLDAFCFACTGSSYLAGHERERAIVGRAEKRFGFPVITATAALEARLRALGAARIALVAPYPGWLLQAAAGFWTARGLDVALASRVETPNPEDTGAIYELTSEDALAAVRGLGRIDADVLVLSGTGMATLPALAEIRAAAGIPVLTSNTALVAEALRVLPGKGGSR